MGSQGTKPARPTIPQKSIAYTTSTILNQVSGLRGRRPAKISKKGYPMPSKDYPVRKAVPLTISRPRGENPQILGNNGCSAIQRWSTLDRLFKALTQEFPTRKCRLYARACQSFMCVGSSYQKARHTATPSSYQHANALMRR